MNSSSRRSTALLYLLLGVVFVASCRDAVMAPIHRIARPPLTPFRDYTPGQPETVTLSANSADASGTVDMTTNFPTPTLVQVTVSGAITQTNTFTQDERPFGPTGYGNACWGMVQIDWDGGTHGSWYQYCDPSSEQRYTITSNVFAVRGTARAFRYAAERNCTQGPGCYSYAGSQTVTVTPLAGDFYATVDRPVTVPYDWPTFRAGPSNGNLQGYWGITEWRWIPDNGNSFVACPENDVVCGIQVTQSGVMRVTAIVNGVIKVKNVRVVVQCMFSPNVPEDSAFARIANDTAVRLLARTAWNAAGVDGPPANRRERIGVFGVDSLGRRHITFRDPVAANDSPCRSHPSGWTWGIRIDTFFVLLHVHPFELGDALPSSCWSTGQPSAYGIGRGGASAEDFHTLVGYPAGWGIIIDRQFIYVYHTPTDMTFEDTPDGLRITSAWQPYIRRYPRETTGCTVP
jgi:hypothetical protein